MARFVWGFDITKAISPTGEVIEPDMLALTPALQNLPVPFECVIEPRSSQHAAIIRQDFIAAESILSDFERELPAEDKAWLSKRREDAA